MFKNSFILVVLGLLALSGCNTIAGVGEDVQKGGAVIEDTATDVKRRTY